MGIKHLLSIDDLSDRDIHGLFFKARTIGCSQEKKYPNAVLLTAFFEPSTRTRLSFEMAAHKLNMGVSAFHASSSSMLKGENVQETVRNLLALSPDVLVIRKKENFYDDLPLNTTTCVINGGDGINEHPTQALLDCFTLIDFFRNDDLHGKRILLIGDVLHSRVAHSNIKLMNRLGAKVLLLAPSQFQIETKYGETEALNSFAELDGHIDAVMCLRVQKERILAISDFSDHDFSNHYRLTMERFLRLGAHCVVLHPGPMNIGIEISQDIAFHSRSLIDEQVRNGVRIRAALLDHCLS